MRIVHRKFGYKTNHHTLKRFLAPYDIPPPTRTGASHFRHLADAYHARWTVVRMAAEGWNKRVLRTASSCRGPMSIRFWRPLNGMVGLEEQRTRPPQHPENQLSLPFLKEVLDLQQAYPRAGRFRLHGYWSSSVRRRPRVSARSDARWPSIASSTERQALAECPRGASRDHQLQTSPLSPGVPPSRFTDIRYLVQLDGSCVQPVCA